ncbi:MULTISPECIES: GH25 family lysozyme [Clostridium]|uniref:Lysozyme n=1 Tax=Clostridium botulinum (strain Eklund 17B / Type B) TaxID=935198 RepID=B2TRW3_CLOBB|nr:MULTISPECIES: GH25 family lysozyme [Clostridium]ACD21988.1 lysozyme M1 [Clostridium botulinum B str. Eklund 17B (NRP)]MBN1038988.1 glycoside hydrolase [Clostridium botulinum]MBN1045858.1 glycoside hydrolase [Clostridium botulinum]MBN1052603.1 glycoside hydrolase [Clostridium botulinum]MBN1055769.1 glycoside hydrolase [Clostridium botulinum]
MKGIDISNHNGIINFTSVKSSGINLVYIKATEGTTYQDSMLNQYYNGANSEGLKTGFYHFLVGTSAPESQAQNFYDNIKEKTNDLKPCLDIEKNGFDVMDFALRFIKKFESLSNLPLCIYSYPYFINDNLDSRLAKYPLWVANYGVQTPISNDVWGDSYVGHQYSETGNVNGINGNVDLNTFYDGILVNKVDKAYVVTQYLPNGYNGDGSFQGVDLNYVLSYMPGIRCYALGDSKGVWIETQMLTMEKCLELKQTLGSWFYDIRQ